MMIASKIYVSFENSPTNSSLKSLIKKDYLKKEY